jgi:mRNA interferase RelE/StbE
MYKVVLSREAERTYKQAEASLARKLARCFVHLEKDPRAGNNVKRLTGPLGGLYRSRVGDSRVVYAVDDGRKIVSVVTIADRRDVYG